MLTYVALYHIFVFSYETTPLLLAKEMGINIQVTTCAVTVIVSIGADPFWGAENIHLAGG
jgi:hypothetical protein